MSANENEMGLQVDPSEKTGEDRMEAAGQEDFDLSVDPSENPTEPPE